MTRATVLILTQWFDPTADHVIEQLNARAIPVFRADTADFPQRATVTASLDGPGWQGRLSAPTRSLSLDEIAGIYYRRPAAFEFPSAMKPAERAWAHAEARIGIGGILATLPGWLNHPVAIAAASYKPVQLASARRAGLTVPRTIITSDPAAATRFRDAAGRAIYKPLVGNTVEGDGDSRILYASLVGPDDLPDPAVSLTAHMFQEWVEHDHAVRLTVIDQQFFACAIYAYSTAAHIDWRSDYPSLRYEITEIPPPIRQEVTSLMAALDLRFGALDFLVTPGGDWVFLEINPNGQWAWIEEETGQPIASAIADALTRDIR